jgi:AbrB family looped-hinge helix DNA binding protein
MKTTIDAAGRLVIPKELREQAGIVPGMELEVRCRDGRIELEPSDGYVTLEERDGFLVGVPRGEFSPISAEEVQKLIDEDRTRRGLIESED